MKKTIGILSGVVMCAAAVSAFAVSSAHYGMPLLKGAAHLGAKAPVPLTVTNNTTQRYNVEMSQANGHYDRMWIESVNYYPRNVISIDNPSWPVHVEISTASGIEFYDQWVYPDQPNVKLNPSLQFKGGRSSQPNVTVTVSK